MSFNFRVSIISLLVLTSSLLCSDTYAYSYDKNYDYKMDTFSPVKNAFESISANHEQIDEEQTNFPFRKSTSPLPNRDVVGLRIVGNKQFILSKGSLFFNDSFDYKAFSKATTFKKYANLLSVELNSLELTNDTLEHLEIFMPKKLFSLLINNCVISESGYELLATILTTRRVTLANIMLKQPNIDKDSAYLLLKTISKNCNANFEGFSQKIKKSDLGLSPTSGLTNFDIMFNVLTPESVKCLANILKKSAPTLNTLSLSWNIVENESNQDNLKDLNINYKDEILSTNNLEANKLNTNCYKELAEAFENLKKLTKLELSISYIPENGMGPLLDGLKNAKDLKEIRIYFENASNIDKINLFKYVEILAHSLKKMRSLKRLDISAMNLPSNAMQVIFNSLIKLENLEVINISQNHLDDDSIQLLCGALKNMKELKTFIANECNITKENFSPLSNALSHLSLSHIFLRGNNLETSVSNLSITKELQVLDLADNGLTFEDAASLAMKTQGSKIQFINFKNNPQIDKQVMTAKELAKREAKKQELAQWRLMNKSSAVFFGLE